MAEVFLKCFGVGDGWPSPDRNHSSFLYQINGTTLIVDCGEPLSRAFKAGGTDYDSIDAVLLSHTHCDHVGGFFMFMQSLWLEQRKRDLPFYMPQDAIQPITNLLDVCYIFPELFAFNPTYQGWEAREPVEVGNLRITPYRTTHLDSLRDSFKGKYQQDFDSFAFLIQSEDYNVVHSADLGAATDLEPLLQDPIDLLVCELAHFSPEEIFNYLKDKAIKKVVFTHIARTFWDDLEQLKTQANSIMRGIEVAFPKDGEEIVITRSWRDIEA